MKVKYITTNIFNMISFFVFLLAIFFTYHVIKVVMICVKYNKVKTKKKDPVKEANEILNPVNHE